MRFYAWIKGLCGDSPISEQHKRVLTKYRTYLVSSVNIVTLIDDVNQHGPLDPDFHQRVKLKTKIPRDHTRDYLDYLAKRNELEFHSFLHVLRMKIPPAFEMCKCIKLLNTLVCIGHQLNV